jgi:3-hydroxybutyryl-CoA dehydrogenase
MRTAVVGAGVMGSGIAQTLAQAGNVVACIDTSREQLDRARDLVRNGRFGLDRAVADGKLSRAQADHVDDLLSFTTSLEDGVRDAELVIEAIPEDLGLKLSLLGQLDGLLQPGTIIASNSSGFSIGALMSVTTRHDSVVGWHWASPPPVMKLAEIVVTSVTSPAVVDRVCELARSCGKNPVVVQDSALAWGYVTNRLYQAMLREARLILADGIVTPEGLDQLMVDAFRWPVGPIAMTMGAAEGWGDRLRSSLSPSRTAADGT